MEILYNNAEIDQIFLILKIECGRKIRTDIWLFKFHKKSKAKTFYGYHWVCGMEGNHTFYI